LHLGGEELLDALVEVHEDVLLGVLGEVLELERLGSRLDESLSE
jgi:hypothetical protein